MEPKGIEQNGRCHGDGCDCIPVMEPKGIEQNPIEKRRGADSR